VVAGLEDTGYVDTPADALGSADVDSELGRLVQLLGERDVADPVGEQARALEGDRGMVAIRAGTSAMSSFAGFDAAPEIVWVC
jgi:hypothetical protein